MISVVICMSPRSRFDTSVIRRVFMQFRLTLLQDMLLSLHEFALEGQNMKFTVNMLLTVAFYIVTPGPAVITTVCEYSCR